MGVAQGLVFASTHKSQSSVPGAGVTGEVAVAGGGEPAAAPAPPAMAEPILQAKLQAVEVAVCRGRGDVRVVGGEAVGGREAVIRVVRYLEQHWDRIPGLRGGGVESLDFFVAFPARAGLVIGSGDGLEGAILVAAVAALTGRGPEAVPSGTVVGVSIDGRSMVVGGAGETRPVRAGVKEAVEVLASTSGVKKILLSTGVLRGGDLNGPKLVGVDDVAGLLAGTLNVVLLPIKFSWRVKVQDAKLLSEPSDEGAASEVSTRTRRL